MVGIVAFMPQGPGDLLRELVVQAVDEVANVVLDIADVQVLPAHVARIENVHEIGEDVDDRFTTGQRLVAQVVDVPALGVRRHQSFGDLGQTFLQSNVRRHGCLLNTIILTLGSASERAKRLVAAGRTARRPQRAVTARSCEP